MRVTLISIEDVADQMPKSIGPSESNVCMYSRTL